MVYRHGGKYLQRVCVKIIYDHNSPAFLPPFWSYALLKESLYARCRPKPFTQAVKLTLILGLRSFRLPVLTFRL